MRKTPALCAIAGLLALLGSCSIFDYSDIVSHKYALVYGVARYILTPLGTDDPNLSYTASDAQTIASALAAQGYTVTSRWVDATGEIFVNGVDGGPINDSSPDPQAPSKATILSDIAAVKALMGPDDVLVIYFSGHGMQDTSSSPKHEWFVPYWGIQYDIATSAYYGYPSLSIRDDELGTVLGAVESPRKVLILDTCNSGGFIGNLLEVDTTPQAYTGGWPLVTPATLVEAISNYFSYSESSTGISPYNAQVLSAAGRDEFCYEAGSLAHSVMTYYLLQGIQASRRADLNDDGEVTVLEAFSYAKAGVEENWNTDSGVIAAGLTFSPHVSGGPVDFVLF